MATQEYGTEVLVSVPLKFTAKIVDFLEDLKAGRATSPDGTVEAVVVPGQGPWDQQMVDELAEDVTYVGVLELLDRCAQKPGEWVNKADVEESIGMDPLKLRNQLGALSKTAKRLFGRVTWPVQWKKEQDGRYVYRMDPTVAKWWNAAREAAA